MSTFIHADLVELATPPDIGGASVRNALFHLARLNIRKGGIAEPTALIAHTVVVSSPLSCEVVAPTCFFHLELTTLPEFCTIVKPLSSKFQISLASNLYLS